MRIISKRALRSFWQRRPDAESPLRVWHQLVASSDWETPGDVKQQFRSASFVADNRVVFNIAGNRYRLVVRINYPYRIVYIRFVGTHAEYDRIDATTI